MKKYLLLIFLLGLLASPRAAAQEFTEGLFTYRVLNDDQGNPTTNVAIVSSTVEDNADVVIPETTTFDGQEYAVTTLTGLSRKVNTLNLSKNIVEIDENFFGDLDVTTEIICSGENPVFSTCDGLLYSKDYSVLKACPVNIETLTTHEMTKTIDSWAISGSDVKTVVLNEGLEKIERCAFRYCVKLSSIGFPESLKAIGDEAFFGCEKLLQSIYIPSSLTFDKNVFKSAPILEYVVSQDNPNYSVFDGNLYNKDLTELLFFAGGRTSIQFPSEIKKIGEEAFSWSNIKEVVIPASVTEIDRLAFHCCSNLVSVALPNTIETLSWYAFSTCRSLREFIIPTSVKYISNKAIGGCRSLESIIVPEQVERVDADAFFGNNKDCKVIFMGDNVEFYTNSQLNTVRNNHPTYYAKGNTYYSLLNIFNQNTEMVRPLPEVLFGSYDIWIGPDSSFGCNNWLGGFSESNAGVSGLQFDVTLPDGLKIDKMEFNGDVTGCQQSWAQLENGDYRFIGYTTDGAAFKDALNLEWHFISDETLKPSEVVVHDIYLSISGTEYKLNDESFRVTGYEIIWPDLYGLLEEGDEYILSNPLTPQLEGISYRWFTRDDNYVAKVEENTLHALKPGSFDLWVEIEDVNHGTQQLAGRYTVSSALWGDADGSKAIDLADVVAVVNKILEREVENFNAKLADVDRNGRINVVDVTQIVKLVLAQPVPDEGEGDVTAAPGLRELSFGEARLGADGKRHISLEIETSSDYTAMQTDIELPEGYIVEAVSLGSELGKHALDYAAVAPQTTRLILYSASLAELPAGRNAAVVDLTLSGAGEGSIRASRALACDADGRSYTLAATEAPLNITTGVSSAESAGMSATAVAGGMEITAPEGTAVTVSDIAGRVLLSFTADAAPAFRPFAPGVYVVAFEASSATAKVLVK